MYNNYQERFEYENKSTIKKGEGRTINAGGLWIYDNEIKKRYMVISRMGILWMYMPIMSIH